MRDIELDLCVETLYDTVGQEHAFAEALGGVARLFDAQGATYLLPSPSGIEDGSAHFAAHGVAPAALADYHSHFFAHDVWRLAILQRGAFLPGFISRGTDLIPARALQKTYFWREFLVPHDTGDILAGVVSLEAPARGSPAFVTFHRGLARKHFETALLSRMRALLPHLSRAIRLHRRIAPMIALGATLEQIFQQMEMPMFFVDRQALPIQANAPAEALLTEGRIMRRSTSGTISHRTATGGWQPLSRAVGQLDQAESAEIAALPESGVPAQLIVRRVHGVLSNQFARSRLFAVVTLRPIREHLPTLATRHGFTPKEMEVAQALMDGLAPRDIAEILKIGLSTVRTHIARLLAKTGTTRQAALVAYLRGGGQLGSNLLRQQD